MEIVLKSKHTNMKKGGEKRMRYSKMILAIGVMALGLATVAFLTNTWAVENVRNTKHNLITNTNIGAIGTTEVCVFCHTPHGGRTDVAGGAAPLWNRNLSTATYTMYTSPNFDATVHPDGQPRGVSMACLSCHDGTVAFDSLLNFGGSGGGPDSTSPISFPTDSFVAADKTFKEGVYPPDPFPNLGTNLSNDHPISMQIPCTKDPQFNDICTNLGTAVDGETGNDRLTAGKVAFLFRGNSTDLPSDIRDRVRAYPTEGGKAYIECASCHNPHESTSSRFLRYPSASTAEKIAASLGTPDAETDRNKGSLLCLSCHQK